MSSPQPEIPELVRLLSWTQASLDLCLDMERNRSDSRFAAQSPMNEIVYVFDESAFELFIGGFDEPPAGSADNHIYIDRRRTVGIFNVREWREKPSLDAADEERRISLNRQSSILTTEWLFSRSLPGMQKGLIHISRWHLQELRARWEALATYYRKAIQSTDIAKKERAEVKALLADCALALENNGPSTTDEIESYIAEQPGELRADLAEFWNSLVAHPGLDERSITRSFWRYTFSRRLAEKLANIRAIGPLAQLVRINTAIAGRLRLLEHAGDIDTPDDIPSSERQPFWRDRIADEIARRERLGIRVDRSTKTQSNDAATLALVQSLANTAVRQNRSKRYVFVSADNLIIDLYRAWHCHLALNYEPFVLRSVRHFAPLLNISNMSDVETDTDEETREKRNIFPALQAAINPFLLTLNLSRRPPKKSSSLDLEDLSWHDDTKRWPREMFALHLKAILQRYRRGKDPHVRLDEAWLRGAIADLRLFPGAHLDRLKAADDELHKISERGRQIERTAIGLGLLWLGVRLDALKVVADVLENLGTQDETALATYIQDMVDQFGSASLDLQVRSLSIADELQSVVSADDFGGVSPLRVPLMLHLTFDEKDRTLSVADEALSMVDEACATEGGRRRRPKRRRRRSFDLDVQDSSLGENGGHRLFALFSCVALRLNKWGLARHYAAEAHYRVGKFMPNNAHDREELRYLLALSTRFAIGMGPILEAAGFDITQQRYENARDLLKEVAWADSKLNSFEKLRAASELVALEIFVSIWSAARDRVPRREHPKLTPDLHLELLHNAWRVTRSLRDILFQNGEVRGSLRNEVYLEELLEQVVTNGAAIFALANVVNHHIEDQRITLILSDADMIEWLDHAEPMRSRGEAFPPITDFYRYWYDRARGRTQTPDMHFQLELEVDVTAQKLFLLGV